MVEGVEFQARLIYIRFWVNLKNITEIGIDYTTKRFSVRKA